MVCNLWQAGFELWLWANKWPWEVLSSRWHGITSQKTVLVSVEHYCYTNLPILFVWNNKALTIHHTSSFTKQFLPSNYLDTNTENEMYKQELKTHGYLVASGDWKMMVAYHQSLSYNHQYRQKNNIHLVTSGNQRFLLATNVLIVFKSWLLLCSSGNLTCSHFDTGKIRPT
jgi:hypothetical protein